MVKKLVTLLWLDDIRNPSDNVWKSLVDSYDPVNVVCPWWVKTFDDFVEWIEMNGIPDIISFDHDLADEHYINNYDVLEKTGYDCAKWLVDYCINNDIDLPRYYCHSYNPVGRANILMLLTNFNHFQNLDRD